MNSVILSVGSTILALVIAVPAAWAMAFSPTRRTKDILMWMLSTKMMPAVAVLFPIYLIFRDWGLLDSRFGITVMLMLINLPIVVWICTDQFRSIPPELEQAARLEGARQFDIFWRIYLPLGLPGVAVSAIFSFIFSWNELLYALVLTRRNVQTAPVAATSFMSGYELPWGKIMATGTVIVLPVTIFALVVSRHMIRGLTMGATK